MPASDPELHNFFEAKPRMVGKVGAGGVPSESSTTIPHTFVGLTDGVAYIVTANRVNATGTEKNKVNETETFIGVANGENFINCVRGVEGAPQAWSADVVLEILFTAFSWNKLIDGIEKEHNQDGTHTATGTGNLVKETSPTIATPTLTSPVQSDTVATGIYDNGNSGTLKEIDWSNGDVQKVTLTGNCTFTYANAVAGQRLTLLLVEDATGGRTITLPTSKYPEATAPDFDTTANAINVIVVIYDGTNYLTQGAVGFA